MLDCIPTRIIVAVISFFGFQCLYLIRFNLSVISVAMIYNGNQCNSSLVENITECLASYETSNTVDWDQRTRGLVLGAFFYGYAFTQIVGGRLAEILGPKIVFGTAISVPGILTLFFPLAAKHHYMTAVGLRVAQGLFQGMSFPSMHCLISQWIPPMERSRYCGIIYLGSTLSIVFTLPVCGLIVELLSWEAAFYITGAVPLIWLIFWYFLFYDQPHQHPRISPAERAHIEKCTAASGTLKNKIRKRVPWKAIVTNPPIIATVLFDIGNSYGLSFLATQLPNYMLSVFNFSVLESGIYSSIPFLFRYIGGVFFSCIVDKLISTSKVSITNGRRYLSLLTMIIPGVLMIFLPMLTAVRQTIIVLCILNFFNGAVAGSHLVNATDLSPNYAGTLYGISNTFGSISAFTSPLVTGLILQESQSQEQWKIAFWMCVPMYIVLEIFYAIFVSGEVQQLNYYDQKNEDPLELEENHLK